MWFGLRVGVMTDFDEFRHLGFLVLASRRRGGGTKMGELGTFSAIVLSMAERATGSRGRLEWNDMPVQAGRLEVGA